ncbi:MAG TPA: hypothetical protein VJ810_39385 [Blastocatellia bacterium]|nr:hypothetical protein [Blastocatellia bacterium]
MIRNIENKEQECVSFLKDTPNKRRVLSTVEAKIPFTESSRMIYSPYDQDARMGAEWETEWQGYKVHLTETVDPDGPQPITSAGRY